LERSGDTELSKDSLGRAERRIGMMQL